MPFTENVPQTTQGKYPWRAVVRTAFAVVASLAVGAPLVFEAATQHSAGEATGGAAIALGVASAITRVLAIPWVENFLQSFIPWLAAAPKTEV